jgi:hypothetical protein
MSGNRFAWERAVKASDLPRGTRLVLLVLATNMDNATRKVSTTNKELAADSGMSERSIYTHLKRAEQRGWIARLSRGHHLAPGSSAPSIYVGQFPEPTGSTVPVGDEANRKHGSDSSQSQPATTSDQPAKRREPTGSTVPTNHSVHSDHCGEPPFDDIDIEVHRQIKAKKDRGEPIRNERALRQAIRQDILDQRELDRMVAEQDGRHGRSGPTFDEAARAAAALGRNLAGVETTKEGLRDAYDAAGVPVTCYPATFDVMVEAWRERTDELNDRRSA